MYASDFTGVATPEYAAHPDGHADPGAKRDERSREEPAARDRRELALDPRVARCSLAGPRRSNLGRIGQFDIGSGDWDARRRPSEIRLDRILQVDPTAVRRDGATLDQGRFEAVARAVRSEHRWA